MMALDKTKTITWDGLADKLIIDAEPCGGGMKLFMRLGWDWMQMSSVFMKELADILFKYNLACIKSDNGMIGYKDGEFKVLNNTFVSAKPKEIEMSGYSLEVYGVNHKEELLEKIVEDIKDCFKKNEMGAIEGSYFIGFDDGNKFKIRIIE
jgi:hypothetical protein